MLSEGEGGRGSYSPLLECAAGNRLIEFFTTRRPRQSARLFLDDYEIKPSVPTVVVISRAVLFVFPQGSIPFYSRPKPGERRQPAFTPNARSPCAVKDG